MWSKLALASHDGLQSDQQTVLTQSLAEQHTCFFAAFRSALSAARRGSAGRVGSSLGPSLNCASLSSCSPLQASLSAHASGAAPASSSSSSCCCSSSSPLSCPAVFGSALQPSPSLPLLLQPASSPPRLTRVNCTTAKSMIEGTHARTHTRPTLPVNCYVTVRECNWMRAYVYFHHNWVMLGGATLEGCKAHHARFCTQLPHHCCVDRSACCSW